MNLYSYLAGCCPVGDADSEDCNCTVVNVGTGMDTYVVGTTLPFEMRRTDVIGDLFGAQVGLTKVISHTVALADRGAGDTTAIATPAKGLSMGDVILFLKQPVAGPGITITNVTDDTYQINSPAAQTPVFQVDSTATLLTDSNTFVPLTTLAGDAKVQDGEEWKINMCVLVCVPHGLGSTLTNAETRWLIETSAGVFTEFDKYSSRDQISIVGDEKSQPMHRTKKLTASMDAPRMLVEVRRTTVGSADFFWEDPRWGGARIEPAP